jgi:hypothetical protein
MRTTARLLASAFLLALALVGPANGEVYAPPVDVEMLVRGPDALPLANTEIEVKYIPFSSHFEDNAKVPTAIAKTDAKGIARFKFPGGEYGDLHVEAAGVGYGDIGITEFAWGKTARPYLPPLAPYCTIEGTVPPEARKPDTIVYAFHSHFDQRLSVKPDAEGHFIFPNARAGEWYIGAGFEKRRDAEVMICVNPGEAIRDVRPKIRLPEDAIAQNQIKREIYPPKGQDMVWVRGHVRDEAGKPIADAKVFVSGEDNGPWRSTYVTRKATTDSQGQYEITGPSGLYGISAALLVAAPGRPPVWAWPPFPRMMGTLIPVGTEPKPSDLAEPITEDVVVPPRGAKLSVAVMKDGKPAAGMFVCARIENFLLPWRVGNEADQNIINDTAFPLAKADNDGVAHFENLPPGRYQVSAGPESVRGMPDNWPPQSETPFGLAEGIPVCTGETARLTLAVHSLPYAAKFRSFHSDGQPFGEATRSPYASAESVRPLTEMNFNRRRPLGYHWYNCPGLWRIESKYPGPRDSQTRESEPYFAIFGIVAVSHCYQDDFVPQFEARWIEPASALVSVLDSAGKPLRAVVEIGWPHDPEFSGSTDENGRISFQGLRSPGTPSAVVCATLPSERQRNIFFDSYRRPDDAAIPSEEELRNQYEIFPQPLVLTRNIETKFTMRQERVGYITGQIRGVAGDEIKDVSIVTDPAFNQPYSYGYIRRSTKEYLAGPFRSGPVRLIVAHKNGKGGETRSFVSAEIRAGEVTRLDITAPPSPIGLERSLRIAEYPSNRNSWFPDPVAAARNVLDGKVFLSDGTTLAWGAQVLYFQPGDDEPKIVRTTDVLGNFKPRGTWWMNLPKKAGAVEGPPEPVVVAFLPGACGAAVVPPPELSDQPMRILLPPAMSLEGQVKVGGTAPSKLDAVVHVMAAYQDKGFLNPLLSVKTTANVDGHFTLAGLTPGTYVVQAALDDIWLSKSQTIHVADETLKPLALDIPSPGAPVVLRLVNSAGKPVIGELVTIERPSGPLTEVLWPHEWTSDGAGVVSIPTLEAGRHQLHAEHSSKPIEVDVPQLPAKGPVEIKITLESALLGAKKEYFYEPREKLPEVPDRPADDPLRGDEPDIKAMVLKKIPVGTKYYLVRQTCEREAWKEANYRPPGARQVWADMTIELGHYKENGKTITVVATFEMDRKDDGEYLSAVRIDKAVDLKGE